MKILIRCMAPTTKQVELGSAFLGVTNEGSGRSYDGDDAGISDIARGKKNVGEADIERAKKCDRDVAVHNMERNVKPLLDPNKLALVIAAVIDVMEADCDLLEKTSIDLVGGKTKRQLAEQVCFDFSEFLTGVLLYCIIYVKNSGTQKESTAVTPEYLASLEEKASVIVFANRDTEEPPCPGYEIYRNGSSTLSIVVGDLLDLAHKSDAGQRPIIVIPVDTRFKTDLCVNAETDDPSNVSPETLHGKWLMRQYARGLKKEELGERIKGSLSKRHGETRDCAKIGSTAILDEPECTFCLLAISEFDENGNAQSTKEDIETAAEALALFYSREGQGRPMAVPLLGTWMSRANLSHQESLQMLVDALAGNAGSFIGVINLVVLPEHIGMLNIDSLRRN